MKNYESLGIQIPDILLPAEHVDPKRWAVIACDQYTSEPEYWQRVNQMVADVPSTYHLILPEVMLGTPQEKERILSTQAAMQRYLSEGVFRHHSGMILVERRINTEVRKGIMLALDLEQYDFRSGSQTLIRASEGTIVDRLPPRMRIREGAALEIPHILVLIDDPGATVIEPLYEIKAKLPQLYDFDLMFDSGHLSGYSLKDQELERQVVHALGQLSDPSGFADRYGLTGKENEPVFLFAMGDGNHSLATAKAIWEKNKAVVGMDHPSRYALVEIENVHDTGLTFEPIHRVLFDLKVDLMVEMQGYFKDGLTIKPVSGVNELFDLVDHAERGRQVIGLLQNGQQYHLEFTQPTSNLAVGTLQEFLDLMTQEGKAGKIDYIHGGEVVARLSQESGNAGFYLPSMNKGDLFRTVILDGVLPRKTFSMGEARGKRFYMECRKIV